jgi:glycosyltransferase involved in cell wall biosynthesis
MKLKNIIIFFPNFAKGGIEKTSTLLSNFFIKKGFKVKFISFDKINFKRYNFSKNIEFYYYKKKKYLFLRNIYCMYILFKILKENNNKDTIVFSLQNSVLSIIISKILNFKIIVRNSAPIDYFKNEKIFYNKFKLFIKMKIYCFSDLIISNSKSSAHTIKKKLDKKNKVVAIPNPITNLNNKICKTKRINKILYVGRLSKEKGIFELVEGFELFNKNFPSFKLDLVGDGHQRKNLSKFISKRNLSRQIKIIEWTNNINKYYKTSKMIILPSYFEGFGNVLIEALNFNLPCVATKNNGPKEILANGKYGFLMKDNKVNTINLSLRHVEKNYNLYKFKAIKGLKNNYQYHINIIGKKYLLKISSVLK